MQMNEDLWAMMLGELPCLDATESCVRELQEMAIANSLELVAIDERVALVQEKIDVARANNLRTISLGIFEPGVLALFEIETTPERPGRAAQVAPDGTVILPTQPYQPERQIGFLDRIADFIANPISAVDDIFAYIGLPLFRAAIGGSAETQDRQIAIADLEIKIAEIENRRGEIVRLLREEVLQQVLEFDALRREFQISQEIARRDTTRMAVLTLDYRFAVGGMDTPGYLREENALDRQRAEVWRNWSRLRTQLTRVRVLVLGDEGL